MHSWTLRVPGHQWKSYYSACMQSTGEVAMMLRAGAYFMHVHTLVPKGYPTEPLSIEVTDSNLPDALVRLEAAKVADMARKMAAYQAPEGDAQAAQARAGAGEAATSKAERLAREGKQTVVSFNKGQASFAHGCSWVCVLCSRQLDEGPR